jgi:hypothetical protein
MWIFFALLEERRSSVTVVAFCSEHALAKFVSSNVSEDSFEEAVVFFVFLEERRRSDVVDVLFSLFSEEAFTISVVSSNVSEEPFEDVVNRK